MISLGYESQKYDFFIYISVTIFIYKIGTTYAHYYKITHKGNYKKAFEDAGLNQIAEQFNHSCFGRDTERTNEFNYKLLYDYINI